MPPATTTSESPSCMPCAAIITDFKPEPQTLLIVTAETPNGMPPWSAACRAGFCPSPACMTQPIMTSSTSSAATPERRTASRTAIAPSCVAVNTFKEPWNLPVGVRAALMITASLVSGMTYLFQKVNREWQIVNGLKERAQALWTHTSSRYHLRFTIYHLPTDYTLARGGVKQPFPAT